MLQAGLGEGSLRIKQLYHDRDEVTAVLLGATKKPGNSAKFKRDQSRLRS
ncbi:hypothetical protein HC761_01715 [bacterium]|nr:hypothetical protein [bacterium]